MQNYSHSLDVDMLNQRYWHRRMQQCKAEFRANHPRPVAPKLTKTSIDSDYQHQSTSSHSLSHQASSHPITAPSNTGGRAPVLPSKLVPSGSLDYSVIEHYLEAPSSQADPRTAPTKNGVAKSRPIPASSKPSRPIKYQVR